MKKTVSMILIYLIFSACSYFSNNQADSRFAVVTYLAPGAKSLVNDEQIKIGHIVDYGDIIDSKNSIVEMQTKFGSVIRISENSVFHTKILGDQEQYSITAGTVLFNINARNHEELKVVTPTAIAAVRGTIFSVAVRDQDTTVIDLYSGRLAISNDNHETNLDGGHNVVVLKSSPMSPNKSNYSVSEIFNFETLKPVAILTIANRFSSSEEDAAAQISKEQEQEIAAAREENYDIIRNRMQSSYVPDDRDLRAVFHLRNGSRITGYFIHQAETPAGQIITVYSIEDSAYITVKANEVKMIDFR